MENGLLAAKRILAGCLAAGILLSLAWYAGYLHSEKQAERARSELWQELDKLSGRIRLWESRQAVEEDGQERIAEASVAPGDVINEEEQQEYYLVGEDGRVTIYQINSSLFEHTGITLDSLPDALKTEISYGKRIRGEQDLYDFLENYSS